MIVLFGQDAIGYAKLFQALLLMARGSRCWSVHMVAFMSGFFGVG